MDAADQCLDNAQAALDRGDLQIAWGFVARAQRMRASERGEQLKQRVKEAKLQLENATRERPGPSIDEANVLPERAQVALDPKLEREIDDVISDYEEPGTRILSRSGNLALERSLEPTPEQLDDGPSTDVPDVCLDWAQAALECGELENAGRWVARALRLRTCERGELLRQLVEEAKLEKIRHVFNSTSDHERLGVGPQATQAEIEKAYLRLTQFIYRDVENPWPEAEEASMIVTEAYERLLDLTNHH